jgi:hypothetical protein
MKLLIYDTDLGRAVSAAAIVGHARLAATPFDQLAMTLAFDAGRAALRALQRAVSLLQTDRGIAG